VLVYIAPINTGPAGSNWVKLYHDGYDGQWAVEKLRANGGRHGITIPDIAPGRYLLRAEIIALHEAFMAGGAQIYMECVQIEVVSPGNKSLPVGVSIPGAYKADDPGILFNLYNGFAGNYIIPGPPVWDGAAGPVVQPPTSPSPSPASTQQPAFSTVLPPTTFHTETIPSNPTSTIPPSAPVLQPSNPPAIGQVAYIYEQCGGINWTGAKACYEGLVCQAQNSYYSQCLSGPGPRPASVWEQCGGQNWQGSKTCHPGLVCQGDMWYKQCVKA
jgi:lytic cellulose monooxygenase (C1-hydroxylating)